MKKILTILSCLLCIHSWAQNNLVMPSVDPEGDSLAFIRMRARMDSIRQYRPTVAVVLAGGGARGMAHLGVLKYMEELGIPVDLIGGTSMGGLVSGLYSLGYNAEYLDSLVRAIDWSVMMSDKIPDECQSYQVRKNKERFALRIPFHYGKEDAAQRLRQQREWEKSYGKIDTHTADMGSEVVAQASLGMPDGFLFGFNVRNILSSVTVGYQDSLKFDHLPIPFYCVATDMASMSEKNWMEGTVVDAMRSTMAIPFYFRPVRLGGMVLSDGGTRNNFPVDIARAMGADIVIGSEMPSDLNLSELNSLTSLLMQNISMMSTDAAKVTRNHTDVLLQHVLEGFNMLSFDDESVSEIIRQGYAKAIEHKEEFEAIAKRIGSGKGQRPTHTAIDIGKQKVRVGEVRIDGIPDKEARYLLQSAFLPKNGLYDRAEIERILSLIYGTRAFESVTYRLLGSEAPFTLVFECKKGQTNEFGASVHVDTDERVYVSAFLSTGTRKLSGLRFQSELKIGNVSDLKLDLSYKTLRRLPVLGIGLRNKYTNVSYYNKQETVHLQTLNTRVDLYAEDARLVYGKARFGITTDFNPYETYLDQHLEWREWDFRSNWQSVFASLKLDTFNDGYFPTQGFRATLDARYVFNGYSIDMKDDGSSTKPFRGNINPYGVGVASLSVAVPMGEHFVFQPSMYAGLFTGNANHIENIHSLVAGGSLAGRYMEYQMPFLGFGHGFSLCEDFAATAEAALRYRLGRKNYLSAKAAVLQDADVFSQMWKKDLTAYAFGTEFARKTAAGPLQLGLHWCDVTGFGVTFSFGFNF